MALLKQYWAGHIYGTNTGNVFAEFEVTDGALSGILRILDSTFGTVVYEVGGTFSDSRLVFTGNTEQSDDGVEYGNITVEATLLSNGNLSGKWESTVGTGGTFQLFPHLGPVSPSNHDTSVAPDQLHTHSATVGAIRLFPDDLNDIANLLIRDFIFGRLVVTYEDGGI